MDTSVVSVALVASQALIREALKALLNSTGAVHVVADASTAANLPPAEPSGKSQVVLIVNISGEESAAALEQIPITVKRGSTLLLTPPDDSALLTNAIELGAMGIVLNNQTTDVLITAIRKVHAGELWLDRGRTASILRRLARTDDDIDSDAMRVQSLTGREREIVALVAEGLSNKQLAERLFISEATARNHLTSILSKLELRDRFHLAVYAFRRGLVLCPQTSDRMRMAAAMRVPAERRRR
jgi:DNA-binding NarL/FixJ family response regulator